jgi:ribosome-interacting GTPase 1
MIAGSEAIRRVEEDMPANLPPDYKAAEQRFREAKTTEDKIAALQEMMAIIPKHKGTDKLRADLRKRLSRLKADQEQQGRKGRKGPSFYIPKEEFPQIILLGTPNVGKSSIVDATTNASPEVADYPYTTSLPAPAMMPVKDIHIQLIDAPPLSPDHVDTWLPEMVRNADATLLVVDLSSDDCADSLEFVKETLASKGIRLSRTLDPSEHELPRNVKPTLVVANKVDSAGAAENLEFLREIVGDDFEIVSVSATTGEGLPAMKQRVFEFLKIVRIYSKIPGHKPDMKRPFVVNKGSTVLDVARKIHREFGDHMKFARVWGSGKFDGQVVERDHVVEDGDVLEIHVDM